MSRLTCFAKRLGKGVLYGLGIALLVALGFVLLFGICIGLCYGLGVLVVGFITPDPLSSISFEARMNLGVFTLFTGMLIGLLCNGVIAVKRWLVEQWEECG